jgi:protoporphyrinogen oxidase
MLCRNSKNDGNVTSGESVSEPVRRESCACCILGAGPAGLAAASELCGRGLKDIILVDRNRIPGGLARTECFDGSRFDVGPHRFFTKSKEINQLWHDTLGKDFKAIDRLTRIYYKNKLFQYPVRATDVLSKLGTGDSTLAVLSFLWAQIGRKPTPVTLEEWVTRKFGKRLYDIFFKTYTEKVWGIPCNEIGAEWAAQRIKSVDVIKTLRKAFFPNSMGTVKSFVERFHYPVLGAGQMYDAMSERVESRGARMILAANVVRINRKDDQITSVLIRTDDRALVQITADQFFSSIPLTHFINMLEPAESPSIRDAAEALFYREHVTVNLLVAQTDLFPDQWIYIHSPDVRMARLTNYNNFSKAMVGLPNRSALSAEYFAFQTEDIWRLSDQEIQQVAAEELAHLGLVDPKAIDKCWVVRETESYPTYYLGFEEPYGLLRARMNEFRNLWPIGRGGMYKYNNQDHSAMTGILAARNYLKTPGSPFDIWSVNIDAEYHEEEQIASA